MLLAKRRALIDKSCPPVLNGGTSQMWTAGMAEKPSNPFGTIIAVDGGE